MDRFGFLIHPLGMKDVVRHVKSAAGKREKLVEKVLEWTPAYHASEVTGVRSLHHGREIVGDFVTVPLFPHQILGLDRQFVLSRIMDACRMAEARGAKIVGLGGYTSVVGSAGRYVADQMEIAVTSGNSYTVATAIEGAMEAARVLDVDVSRASVTVIGATGSIGSVCARILARRGVGRLNLVARSKSRLQQLVEVIHRDSRTAVGIESDVDRGLLDADIVISATTSGGGIIRPDFLKPGAIICDVAVPHDVCREVATLRPDVLVIEGGVVEAPGEDPRFNFDFGFPEGICLACMAETMALTLEGRFEDYSLGRGLEMERVEEIRRIASRHGFRVAGFRAFDEPITVERIEEVRTRAREVRRALRVVG